CALLRVRHLIAPSKCFKLDRPTHLVWLEAKDVPEKHSSPQRGQGRNFPGLRCGLLRLYSFLLRLRAPEAVGEELGILSVPDRAALRELCERRCARGSR